jgi:hypothetical protein
LQFVARARFRAIKIEIIAQRKVALAFEPQRNRERAIPRAKRGQDTGLERGPVCTCKLLFGNLPVQVMTVGTQTPLPRNGRVRPIVFSNESSGRVLSGFDTLGCLRYLRARLALDGVSWARIEIILRLASATTAMKPTASSLASRSRGRRGRPARPESILHPLRRGQRASRALTLEAQCRGVLKVHETRALS